MTPEERTEVMLKARWNARQNAGDTQVPASTRILAIASGKGGVGKSSVTVNLAVALAATGRTVGVLDADIWGFSVPRLLGMTDRMEAARVEGSERPMIIPNELAVGAGRLKVVSTGFLVEEDTALMWRGLMLTKAVEQFLRDVRWGELDDLLIDMPPGTGDVQMGLARMLPRTDMVIVTTPAQAAQKVAQRAADMAKRSFVRVVGVIENMTDFTCQHGTTYRLFGAGGGAELAAAIDVPLLGQIPLEPAVSAGGDAGRPVALETGERCGPRRGPSPPLPTGWTRSSARLAHRRRGHGRLLGPPARRRRGRPRRPAPTGDPRPSPIFDRNGVPPSRIPIGDSSFLTLSLAVRRGRRSRGRWAWRRRRSGRRRRAHARFDARWAAGGVDEGQHLVRRGAPGDRPQVGDGRRHHPELTAGGLAQRIGGPDPHAVHRLGVVVRARLVGRGDGEEEAGVEPARRLPDRRHPVGDVAHGGQLEHQPVATAQIDHRQLAGVDGMPIGVGGDDRSAVGAAGEQDAGLLEALAHRRHEVRQATLLHPQRGRCRRIVEPVAVRLDVGTAVGGVDLAAREDVHPAGEHGARRAAQHEHLQLGLVAHDHDRRRRSRRDRVSCG